MRIGATSQAKTSTSSRLGTPRTRQIDREGGERHQAAEQPRRDEGAMARRRQRVLLRRRMHQAST